MQPEAVELKQATGKSLGLGPLPCATLPDGRTIPIDRLPYQ